MFLKHLVLRRIYTLCILLLLCAATLHAQKKFDVVIYGATPGGITAAIQAAKLHKSVVLIESSAHVGGHITEGLGSADIDNHKEFRNSAALGGMALEFYKALAAYYSRSEAFNTMLAQDTQNTSLWKTEPHVAEQLFERWLTEAGVTVVKRTMIAEEKGSTIKQGTVLKQIKTTDGKTYEAKVFIDATYEGDLLNAAGVTTTVGRESNSQYGETLNGIRKDTRHAQFAVKVDPYNDPGNPASGVIATIQNEPFGVPDEGDSSVQAYCFRVCLSADKANQTAFYKPEKYDRNNYEIYLRYLKAGGKLYTPKVNLPNKKTDLGAWHDLSHNLYGMNRDYPQGNFAKRKEIIENHAQFTQGLFYFLSTDTAVARLAPALQQEWSKWGYAKDEFTDNHNFPHKFYVRDARRMVSDYVITEKTCAKQSTEQVLDPVAVAYWPMDVHSVRRIVKNGFAYNEGFVFAGNIWKPFGISYRALVPKPTECTNLLTATTPSSSHIAFGAIRLEHNFMDLGQVCAIAAAIAINNNTSVQNVKYDMLKKYLLDSKLVIDAATVGLPSDK